MSDSVRSHRRQPTRLPHPWDSPGKNTGVGCHFLLQSMKVKRESEVAQSCPTLRDPMDCSPQGSPVHGIFQARVLEWGAIAFSHIFELISQEDSLEHHLKKKIAMSHGMQDLRSPEQRSNLGSLHWTCRALTTGLLRNSGTALFKHKCAYESLGNLLKMILDPKVWAGS